MSHLNVVDLSDFVTDVASRTLAAVLFYLLKHPSALARLQREIKQAFSRVQDIRMGPQMQSCTWLRACIDEAMRMSPAVPGLLPREVLRGGLSIPSLNISLPAGVNVGTCIYAIHHSAEHVVDPFVYDPARWLHEAHRQDKEALLSVFNPFSLGHRACLGKPLVYMELSIAIARLVWEFDMTLAPHQHVDQVVAREIKQGKRRPDEYQYQDWFLSNNFGPTVQFRTRSAGESVGVERGSCDKPHPDEAAGR